MIASAFDEENTVLGKPDSMTADECDPLSVWRGNLDNGQPVIISCWKMSALELAEVNRTGRVWLVVWGDAMPPVCPLGTSPFTGAK